MKKVSTNSLLQMQNCLTDILSWFHNFCCEYNLKYYIIGGTQLGASRHQGFIPWDDDIDVGMPRSDYLKFIQLMEGSNQRYVLETPYTAAADYFYTFSKIYDTHTTLVQNTKHKIKRGVYIDIFPLDGIGDSETEGKANYKKILFLSKILALRTDGIRSNCSFIRNVTLIFMQLIPSCFINNKRLLMKIDKLCSRRDFNTSLFVGNLVGVAGYKELMPREYLGDPTLYSFGEIKVFGVEQPDKYLTHIYGDWRKFPPEECRTSHHDILMLNLERSFLEK